jgi:hypothetical protein
MAFCYYMHFVSTLYWGFWKSSLSFQYLKHFISFWCAVTGLVLQYQVKVTDTSFVMIPVIQLKSKVTLRVTVCLGVETTLGLVTRFYFLSEGCCLKVEVLFPWGVLSDERTGLQFALQSLNVLSHAEPRTIHYYLIRDSPNLEDQVPIFISPRNRVAQLYPQALGSTLSAEFYQNTRASGPQFSTAFAVIWVLISVIFWVLTAVTMRTTDFWSVPLHSLEGHCQCS